MGNLQSGELDWSNLSYTSNDDDIKKYKLYEGDVLFNRTNSPELVGKTAVYRGIIPAVFAGYMIRINYKKTQIVGYYLNYFMNSQGTKEWCNTVKTDGVNQSNINAKKLASYPITLPPLPEQKEIVRILDTVLAKENEAKKTLEQQLEKIELFKKAILAKAFLGELGTNNPSEESSLNTLSGKNNQKKN